jgi:hypothetical protein
MLNMEKVSLHASAWLACVLFVSLSLIGSVMAEGTQNPNTADSLAKVREFHSKFIHHAGQSELSLVQPQLCGGEISFPKASVPTTGLDKFFSDYRSNFPNSKDNVVMNGSHSVENVKDLVSLNANRQRDIVFEDSQYGDPMKQGLKNSQDIMVSGNGKGQSRVDTLLDGEPDDVAIENLVDNAISSRQHNEPVYYQSQSGSPGQRLGNYLNIDVSGIDVKAINTVQGGSAVATSNIVIKPVQIINCHAEVEEKLK